MLYYHQYCACLALHFQQILFFYLWKYSNYEWNFFNLFNFQIFDHIVRESSFQQRNEQVVRFRDKMSGRRSKQSGLQIRDVFQWDLKWKTPEFLILINIRAPQQSGQVVIFWIMTQTADITLLKRRYKTFSVHVFIKITQIIFIRLFLTISKTNSPLLSQFIHIVCIFFSKCNRLLPIPSYFIEK